ncbi:MAG: metal-sensing transcriptional repressor [Flavobacteriales bacterium]
MMNGNVRIMIPKDLTRDIKDRISNIKGQLEGISSMLDQGDNPEKILNQFKAAQNGLDKANYKLLDEVYRKALAIKIVEANNACPGNCGNEEKIQYIKKEFPNIDLNDLTNKMNEINEVGKRIEEYNAKSPADH